MKRITLVGLIILGCSCNAFGQFKKGTILAGGSIGASFTTNKTITGSTTTTNSSTNSFSLSPQVGYFIIDDFTVGAGVQLSTSSLNSDDSSYKRSQTFLTFEPFTRYYFDKFYGQAGIGFGSYSSESTDVNFTSSSKGSVFNWSIIGGYAILLNNHVAIEPQIGYKSTSLSADGSNSTNRIAGLYLQLGFQIYIHK
jgi:outer membrane protein